MPGLPQELLFDDGARFIPDDAGFRWQAGGVRVRWLEWLESRWLVILLALLVVPLTGYWLMVSGVPRLSALVAGQVPQRAVVLASQNTLATLDSLYLDPSGLTPAQQQEVLQRWQLLAKQLPLSDSNYQLQFRHFGQANAFALPDGTLVLSDSLVERFSRHPQALDAVLLHEVGHVHYRHGLQLMVRSVLSTLVYALMFGDLDGMGDILVGSGAGLLNKALSRDMERQADRYAMTTLAALGRPADAFAEAMKLLQQPAEHPGEQALEQTDATEPQALQYLSTHPATEERIRLARQIAACQHQQGIIPQCLDLLDSE
ncbi:M48 family metallopeptidase [Oceanobacter mangrovi]|uniref:M48 family metallopeptidase n=1 Tax=Oceanobacter mangrovi TaxID=2862510 RepID=UPI001C8E28C0|nr:M48 family metallopeptidase [Oceanobacter mangrovi]